MDNKNFNIKYITEFNSDTKNDWADIVADFEDGRSYTFTVETLSNIEKSMKENNKPYFYEEDILIVNEMNKENIEMAVKEMVENNVIEKYGILVER